jgi:flagellar protein FliO/FliZ
MELLFGGMPDAARFLVAFMLVLGLIGAGALLWRRFGVGPLAPTGPRGRQPRLAVIDAAFIDARRRLVLVKRDNTEHLLMIGGPTDIVIESNITRAGAMGVSREPRPIPNTSRQSTSTEGPDWTLPLEPMARPSRPNGELDGGLPEPSPRSAREAMVDSMRAVRSAPAARRSPAAELDASSQDDEITAPSLTSSPSSAEVNHRSPAVSETRPAPSPQESQRPQPTSEPSLQPSDVTEPKRAAAPTPRQVQSEENSLAEMAQRLEAALRRPTKPIESPAPAPATVRLPPVRSEPAAARKPAHLDSVGAGKGSVKVPEQLSAAPPDLKVLSGKAKAEPATESLEDEMAKMLGRAPGKS